MKKNKKRLDVKVYLPVHLFPLKLQTSKSWSKHKSSHFKSSIKKKQIKSQKNNFEKCSTNRKGKLPELELKMFSRHLIKKAEAMKRRKRFWNAEQVYQPH